MTPAANKSQLKPYVCINCGNAVAQLAKRYSNSIKVVNCDKCHRIADCYIEFEPVITLVDAVLLSEPAFRHMLYNRDFKLQWKLSLVLLLLESFALWRKRRTELTELPLNEDMVYEKGFYICCLQNIFDYLATAFLLFLISYIFRGYSVFKNDVVKYAVTLLKAVAIANFSKFLLLPIMVWRDNTTEFGSVIHHMLVLGHHLFSLIYVYAVVSKFKKYLSFLIVIPVYFIKEFLKKEMSVYMEENL